MLIFFFAAIYPNGFITPKVQAPLKGSGFAVTCIGPVNITWRFTKWGSNKKKLIKRNKMAIHQPEKLYVRSAKFKHTGKYECEGPFVNGTRFVSEGIVYVAGM